MVSVEREEDGHDRIPCVLASCDEVIPANLAGGCIVYCARFDPLAVGRVVRRNRCNIKDARVMREARDELLERHLRQLLRGEIGAGFHQDFDPDAEPLCVELFVESGPCGPPQVEIENA